MNVQNKIKVDIILSLVILLTFFIFLAFISILAKEEGTLGNNWILNFIADYIIYIFPLVLLCIHLKFVNTYFLILIRD